MTKLSFFAMVTLYSLYLKVTIMGSQVNKSFLEEINYGSMAKDAAKSGAMGAVIGYLASRHVEANPFLTAGVFALNGVMDVAASYFVKALARNRSWSLTEYAVASGLSKSLLNVGYFVGVVALGILNVKLACLLGAIRVATHLFGSVVTVVAEKLNWKMSTYLIVSESVGVLAGAAAIVSLLALNVISPVTGVMFLALSLVMALAPILKASFRRMNAGGSKGTIEDPILGKGGLSRYSELEDFFIRENAAKQAAEDAKAREAGEEKSYQLQTA